jgi:hypothetical protein
MCVFVAAVGVVLSVALQWGSMESYIPFKSLSTGVFFFFWSSHLWFSIVFFNLVGKVLHAP